MTVTEEKNKDDGVGAVGIRRALERFRAVQLVFAKRLDVSCVASTGRAARHARQGGKQEVALSGYKRETERM